MKRLGVFIFLVLATSQVSSFTKQYLIVNNLLNWFQANQACLNRGLQMAIVNSAVEQEAFKAAVERSGVKEYIWIGGNDLAYEGNFTWISTGAELAFTNWNANEPNNAYDGEHCVGTYYSHGWNDWGCDKLLNYACEWKTNCNQGVVNYNPHFY